MQDLCFALHTLMCTNIGTYFRWLVKTYVVQKMVKSLSIQ